MLNINDFSQINFMNKKGLLEIAGEVIDNINNRFNQNISKEINIIFSDYRKTKHSKGSSTIMDLLNALRSLAGNLRELENPLFDEYADMIERLFRRSNDNKLDNTDEINKVKDILDELDNYDLPEYIKRIIIKVRNILSNLSFKYLILGEFYKPNTIIIYHNNIDNNVFEIQLMDVMIHETFHYCHYKMLNDKKWDMYSRVYPNQVNYAEVMIESLATYYELDRLDYYENNLLLNNTCKLNINEVRNRILDKFNYKISNFSYAGAKLISSVNHFEKLVTYKSWSGAITKLLNKNYPAITNYSKHKNDIIDILNKI